MEAGLQPAPETSMTMSDDTEHDQTDDSAYKPSFDETVSESELTPPPHRRSDDFNDTIPDPEDFNHEVVASSPVKKNFEEDVELDEDGEQREVDEGEGEEEPPDESWHPINGKEDAKEDAKKAKKQKEKEKKEEKARLARENKEKLLEEKAKAAEEKAKLASEKKEKRERDKMERQSKREKPVKEKKEKEKPPPRPQVRSPGMMLAKVLLLDGETLEIEIEKGAKGFVLNDVVCDHQNLVEKEYFGLTYVCERIWYWLDPEKKIKHQLKKGDWDFEFRVKFYPPEPLIMKEDITRYFLCQQIRNDINICRLPCSMLTAAILGSYTAQSEIGDYDAETANGLLYLQDYQFSPNQTPELLMRIADLHKVHNGQTPADADIHYLENSMKLAMYGVDLHQCWDSDNVELMLGVCWAGINVYKDKLRINRFPWPKILKISYKKNRFFLKIRPGEFEHFENTIGFKCRNHILAKRLWKVAVEQHTFFRKKEPELTNKHMIPRFGSKFRYSGRTIYQSRTSNINRPCPAIDRSFTLRKSRSLNMGGSLTRLNMREGYGNYRGEPGYNTIDVGGMAAYNQGHLRRTSGSSEQLNPPQVLEEGSTISSIPDGSSLCSSLPPRGPHVGVYSLPPGSSDTKKEYYMIASTERLCDSPIDKAMIMQGLPYRNDRSHAWRRHPDGHLHPPKSWPAQLNWETPHSLNEIQEEQAERWEQEVRESKTPALEVQETRAPVLESDML